MERHAIPIGLTKKNIKKIMVSETETFMEMAEEEGADLLKADLKEILILTGSFLYSGGDLSDVESCVIARINELAVKHLVDQDNQVPKGVTIQ